MTDENRELLERGQRALNNLTGARVVDARAVQGAVVLELAFRGTDDGAASLTVPLDGIHFWDDEESA